MKRSTENRWLSRFAFLTALATLFLVGLGGVVTSKGVGMAVPDWPNTFGENMFLFPFSKWVGGVFYEHSHRLVASGVGMLTTILAVWLWLKESRRWLRWLGVAAFLAVILQGVLGGLRVVFDRYGWGTELGIFHATMAQLFFVLICSIALFTTRWWQNLTVDRYASDRQGRLRYYFLATTFLILGQLMLGATMRHQHAGLAIPDFPLAYGKVWPAMDAESVAVYNQNRIEVQGDNPITAFQVGLQMVHRIMAVAILLAVVFSLRQGVRHRGWRSPLTRLSCVWLGLIAMQIALGAATIWSDKKVDVTTAHVAVGALSLVNGALLSLIAFRSLKPARVQSVASMTRQAAANDFTAQPSSAGHLQ
ncbi:MAG: COX15/CtaA family protein [Verrucomicrobia bacterium]|nr:COX15/CtaA family protein [Verrucomicrobiota bacterium]